MKIPPARRTLALGDFRRRVRTWETEQRFERHFELLAQTATDLKQGQLGPFSKRIVTSIGEDFIRQRMDPHHVGPLAHYLRGLCENTSVDEDEIAQQPRALLRRLAEETVDAGSAERKAVGLESGRSVAQRNHDDPYPVLVIGAVIEQAAAYAAGLIAEPTFSAELLRRFPWIPVIR